jgi:uncharacterized MAPEG superfamily protein
MTVKFTVAYACVFLAVLLPLVCAGLAKFGGGVQPRKTGGYDNENPRGWLATQTDWRARANAAQANSFEALPFFIGAVIIAHQLAAPQTTLDILCFLFVVLRVLYITMYVGGLGNLRSLLWTTAFVINTVIFFLGYR